MASPYQSQWVDGVLTISTNTDPGAYLGVGVFAILGAALLALPFTKKATTLNALWKKIGVFIFGAWLFLGSVGMLFSFHAVEVICDTNTKSIHHRRKTLLHTRLQQFDFEDIQEIRQSKRTFHRSSKSGNKTETYYMPQLLLKNEETFDLLTAPFRDPDKAEAFCLEFRKAISETKKTDSDTEKQ